MPNNRLLQVMVVMLVLVVMLRQLLLLLVCVWSVGVCQVRRIDGHVTGGDVVQWSREGVVGMEGVRMLRRVRNGRRVIT